MSVSKRRLYGGESWRETRALEQAERYKYRKVGNPWRGSGPNGPLKNKYGGKCHYCGGIVEAGAGTMWKDWEDGGKWRVKHRVCPKEDTK